MDAKSPLRGSVLRAILHLYQLINAGELETYREGKARKITIRSLEALIERRLAAAKAAGGVS